MPILLACVALTAGCGGGNGAAATSSFSGTGHAPTTTAAGAPKDGITGFGATMEAWNANHKLDRRYSAATVYNSDPKAPTGADYNQVMFEDGRALGYDLRFPSLSITAARAKVAHELPRDAHRVAFTVKDVCAFELLRSATLGRALGAKIGDPSGAVLVEFGSGVSEDHYDASAVSGALFSLGATSPSSIPAC
jgi:hypothetical protein